MQPDFAEEQVADAEPARSDRAPLAPPPALAELTGGRPLAAPGVLALQRTAATPR